MMMTTAILFAIKRYALHDGPNIRTTVFFKGCPLKCFWCHNPEGISPRIEIVSISDRCIGCNECIHGCPQSALSITAEGLVRKTELCDMCMSCVEICPALCHEAIGWRGDLATVMEEIKKDLPFYDRSGGGVTFSGGEPLLQAEPLLSLLQACGDLGIHRAVDTTGFAPTGTLLEVAGHTELFLYDLKHMDAARHTAYTGVSNELILRNLEKLSHVPVAIRIRIPLLAGINDDEDNIRATGAFAARIAGLQGIDILPYHHIATAKYTKLDQEYRGDSSHIPGKDIITRTREILEHFGHEVRIGG